MKLIQRVLNALWPPKQHPDYPGFMSNDEIDRRL